jgi:hypothetical protein
MLVSSTIPTQSDTSPILFKVTVALRLEPVPIGTLAAFLEACAAHPCSNIEEVAGFAGFSAATARRALPSLESLGLVSRGDDGVWRAAADGVVRGMGSESVSLLIRQALQGFRPFEALTEGLALGEDVTTASRKAALALGLTGRDADRLAILLRWGVDLGILEDGGSGIRLAPEMRPKASPAPPSLSAEDLESEARARLYNVRSLGREANNYLDETDRKLLAEALLSCETKPRDSIEHTGQALEDFLREVAGDKGLAVDAGKLNGIGQLANLLCTKGVLHNHHEKLADAVSTVRNAAAHRKDKKTMSPWTITPLAAFSAHSTALIVVRSVHQYAISGRQVI